MQVVISFSLSITILEEVLLPLPPSKIHRCPFFRPSYIQPPIQLFQYLQSPFIYLSFLAPLTVSSKPYHFLRLHQSEIQIGRKKTWNSGPSHFITNLRKKILWLNYMIKNSENYKYAHSGKKNPSSKRRWSAFFYRGIEVNKNTK